jgi:hypothetical protein
MENKGTSSLRPLNLRLKTCIEASSFDSVMEAFLLLDKRTKWDRAFFKTLTHPPSAEDILEPGRFTVTTYRGLTQTLTFKFFYEARLNRLIIAETLANQSEVGPMLYTFETIFNRPGTMRVQFLVNLSSLH